jgi:hypothetical protein
MTDAFLPKTSLLGLLQALDLRVPIPTMLPFDAYQSLPEADQIAFDKHRRQWLVNGLRVSLPAVTRLSKAVRRNIDHNQTVVNGRRGILLTGDWLDGKTESAVAIARQVERRYQQLYPDYREQGKVPVVWVEMPSNSTGKQFVRAIIAFFWLDTPPPQSWTTDRLIALALDLLHRHGTLLVVCDEAHNISSRRGMGSQGEASDVIKQLQNNSTATFLLCGIDLLGGQVFGTPRGMQVTARCDQVRLGRAVMGTDDGDRDWRILLGEFDEVLPLCDHRPGWLIANARLLHQVTGGSLGKLAMFIHRLVLDIMGEDGRTDERITRERLWATLNDVAQSTGYLKPIRMEDIADPDFGAVDAA